MLEVEITQIVPLSPEQENLIDMHSLYNVMNILIGELYHIGNILNDEGLEPSIAMGRKLLGALTSNPQAVLDSLQQTDAIEQQVMQNVETVWHAHSAERDNAEVREAYENLQSVFKIVHVRARELLARHAAPEAWLKHDMEQLRENFLAVFNAIEKNSKGRYRIVFNLAQKVPQDYYIDIGIDNVSGKKYITMPMVLQDVMRDLMANARKYTEPGGRITGSLFEDKDELTFLVEDNGRGIPTHEIEEVVFYGKRASNVGMTRTMGGGFGLTKAFLVTKQFGGRMWIASQEGAGTKITLRIPRPTTA